MIAPIPSSVRSRAVSVRLSALPPCSASPTSCSIDFVLRRFESIHPPVIQGWLKSAALFHKKPPHGRSRRSGQDGARKTIRQPASEFRKQRDELAHATLGIAPASRSLMTARPAAPASTTLRARSSVMPPIATTGLPRPAAYRTRSSPRARVAGVLRARAEYRPDGDVGRRRVERLVDLRSIVGRNADDRRLPDDARARRRPSDRPGRRGHRPPRSSRAMSARSLTMTTASDARARAHHASREREKCGARSGPCREAGAARAPPARYASAQRQRIQPPRGAHARCRRSDKGKDAARSRAAH